MRYENLQKALFLCAKAVITNSSCITFLGFGKKIMGVLGNN
jgi:hypothetical protein